MRSIETQLLEVIPAMRRYARVVVLNTVVADQFVKESLEESQGVLTEDFPGDLKLTLFRTLVQKLAAKSFDRNGERDLTSDALKALLGGENRNDAASQDLVVGLSHLHQPEREVLILAAMEGFRYKEIGKMVGIPLSTVMSLLHSAREQMRDSLFGAR